MLEVDERVQGWFINKKGCDGGGKTEIEWFYDGSTLAGVHESFLLIQMLAG